MAFQRVLVTTVTKEGGIHVKHSADECLGNKLLAEHREHHMYARNGSDGRDDCHTRETAAGGAMSVQLAPATFLPPVKTP